MKDAIKKNLPVGVTLNGSATSNALAGRVAALSLKANQISNQTSLICICKKLVKNKGEEKREKSLAMSAAVKYGGFLIFEDKLNCHSVRYLSNFTFRTAAKWHITFMPQILRCTRFFIQGKKHVSATFLRLTVFF